MSQESKSKSTRGRVVTVVLLGLTALVAVGFAGALAVIVVMMQSDTTAEVPEGSFLGIVLQGAITDAPGRGGVFMEPENFPPTATEVAAAIRHAKDDERVAGIFLRMKNPSMGWGLAREMRTALVEYRESGKPCVAFGEVYTMKDYYLASACDKVVIAPAGVPFVMGQSLTVTYYRDALAYLGVKPRFVHVGDYKTAVEPYERMEPSEAAKVSYEYLLDGLWDVVVEEIAASRGKTVDELRHIIDNPALSPRVMTEAGLFDAVAYNDAVIAHLDKVGQDDWVDLLQGDPVHLSDEQLDERFTSLGEYRKELLSDNTEERIAVVFAEGAIMSGKSDGGLFGGEGLYDGDFREWMRSAREDDTVKAVVVRVNSPGGSALASDMMHREVVLTRAIGKPVVISMADYAASGGYMMSCNADWIVAQPTTITGSIGVFGTFFDVSESYSKLLLADHTYKRGARADLMQMTAEQDEVDREILQAYVQETYDGFVNVVAEGRGQEPAFMEQFAQGRVWTGTQAMGDRHLVDELGGLPEALAKAQELANITDPGIVNLPEKKGFMDLLMEEMAKTEAPKVQVELALPIPGAEEAFREIALLAEFQRSGGVVAYLPGHPSLR
ncbi:MAG: protease-4 [Kiritimatiellia bacterium]|jgi:protease-4